MGVVKTIALVFVGLAVGLALATFWQGGDEPLSAPRSDGATDVRRLVDLELALIEERERRTALERRIDELDAEVDLLSEQTAAPAIVADDERADERAARATAAAGQAVAGEPPGPPGRAGQRFATPEQRAARLVEGGFTPQRAQWLMDRTEALRMESLQAVYEARREGRPVDASIVNEQSVLRREIGDAEYEQYLRALGRPTAVGVSDVFASSPAETAGLRPGDQIVSYAGARVFDMRELNQLTYEGETGQPVVVEVLRDGQRIQVVLPRGPVGITAGRSGGRP